MKNIFLSMALLGASYLSNAQHTLVLKTGEKMNGTLQTVKDGNVSFLFKGNAMNFKMGEVSEIILDAKGEEQKASTAPADAGMRGVSFVMAGRNLVKPPKIDNLTMEKGIVVVALTIDKDGNVRKAEPGAEGTTTTSSYLLTKAKQAAQTVQFDKCPKCPLESQGTITITF
jgi:hypothetical protein